MLRQVSSRNQRSKGFKVKYVLQICVLVAISIWLLYQVKHSHDKRKTFGERSSKILRAEESQSKIFKFSRKDLPNTVETDSAAKTYLEGEEKEEAQEVEREVKQEESDDREGRVAGEDMIDEQDQERADEEADHGDEEEEEATDEEGKGGQSKESDLLNDQEHEESTQEARERTFKGDDASSAVVGGTQTVESEPEIGNASNLDEEKSENQERDDMEAENRANEILDGVKANDWNIDGLENNSQSNDAGGVLEGNNSVSSNSITMNMTAMEKTEIELSKLEDASNSDPTPAESNKQMEQQTNLAMVTKLGNQTEVQMNTTAITVSNSQMETQGNTTVVGMETNRAPPHNETSVDTEANGMLFQNETTVSGSVEDRNATMVMGTPGEDTSNSEKVVMEQVGESTIRQEESKESSNNATDDHGDTAQGESNNSSHNAVAKEGSDALSDMSTLPGIQNETKSGEGEAAE